MTPCEELGYKVGNKFKVLLNTCGFAKGAIVELYRDDGDDIPLFKGSNSEYTLCGEQQGAYLSFKVVKKIDNSDDTEKAITLLKGLGYTITKQF